ncbi:hypothetical protein D8674_023339 [Pyrus ussuriensis x Pyrus communis]|uniref:Uncharacterized protein n=1 Tax=Pyrus ussuriensis x Pyrus communis TaxID=2448454 RepID=A0A5N5GS68_9ROSA|nr:hypothetical protein D8674_023339 [Pyrus ussuriensis x Pyrus communis]
MEETAEAHKSLTGSQAGLSPKPKGLMTWIKTICTSRPNKMGFGLDLHATPAALVEGIRRRWSTMPLQAMFRGRCKQWFIRELRFDDGS